MKYMQLILLLLAFSLPICPVWGQKAALPRAKAPLLLLDFEGVDGVKDWTGIKCESTTNHFSNGTSAMSFTIPKWVQGADQWPSVILDWNKGKGYSTKDWSHYAKVTCDVWIEGNESADIALELRDKPDQNGWAAHYTILPNQKNTIEVFLQDIKEVNLTNIRRMLFFTSSPPRSFTITVDNFRLLPGQRDQLADFDLVYPNYRELVFPKVKAIKVSVGVNPAEYDINPNRLALEVTAVSGKIRVSSKKPVIGNASVVMVPTAKLPVGVVQLSAAVVNTTNGKKVADRKWVLRKITQSQVASFKTYIDENNNTITYGKPFFPLGWYDDASLGHLNEIIDSPFNCILNYGTNLKPKDYMLKYMDIMQQHGLKLIYCMNDVYPTATYLKHKGWEGIKGNEKIVPAVVKAYRTHPAILAWYLNDEIPRTLAPRMKNYYMGVRNADPNHPGYIVLCNMSELKYFPDTTDIMGVDPYPVPSSPVTTVSQWMDDANASVRGHKPTWLVPQAFAWYQYGAINPNRGHIPSTEELKTGRAPTYEESRCMTYLALTHGAKGLIYYCYYDLRVLPQYKEIWAEMKKIGQEVKTLSPVLLSPSDLGSVAYTPTKSAIHTKLKKCDDKLYLIAVNAGNTACTVTFDVKRKLGTPANVMFEDREIKNIQGSKLTDDFKPLEVHVYDLGK